MVSNGAAKAAVRIPRIDLAGVVDPGSAVWAAARDEVAAALVSAGFFEAVYPQVAADLRDEIFSVLKEVFELPLEVKLRNVSDKPFHSYLGQIPYLSYESLAIFNADLPSGVQNFSDLLWPGSGNPNFSDKVCTFSRLLSDLDKMVRRMVLESLGLYEKYYDAHVGATRFQLRISEYGAIKAGEEKLGLIPHRDKNTMAIICQNEVDGLEIQTQDGEWIAVKPSQASVVVIAGDHLRAWTNGRIYSPLHRVSGGKTTRYSTILFSIPDDELLIEAAPEMIDGDHPAIFKPYKYAEYINFCMSERGLKSSGFELDAFCGINNNNKEKQQEEERA